MTTRGRGAQRGAAQPHRLAYDPSTGKPWRTGVQITADEAGKAIRAAQLSGMSFAGLVTELIRRMEIDENGRPVWVEDLAERQEELPQAG